MTGGLFAILDDVAMLLDDTAAMSKIAAKKTAGVLGDDLAVNAEKATGFHASRELPVLWAITKGSLLNKLIILPLAFLLSAYLPWLIVPILLLGGAYLSFEGVEKVNEVFFHRHAHKQVAAETLTDKTALLKAEKAKIKSAVRTDFILSIEIIMIALGTVMEQPLGIQFLVVSLIAVAATAGVYGLVALLVRMDDAGFHLIERAQEMGGASAQVYRRTGALLVSSLPKVIKVLGIIGTVAMLLVGGGMFVHNIDAVHHALAFMPALAADLAAGLVVGGIVLGGVSLWKAVTRKSA
jgi:predicted DNA repair protein MutK